MKLPINFSEPEIDKGLLAAGSDMGDYFQKFCSEVFAKKFQNASHCSRDGVDGGIDGTFEDDKELAFWEAKYIGDASGIDNEVVKRWNSVAQNLKSNLRHDKPASSQYQPWYSPSQVTSYHFCVSQRLANPAQRSGLQKKIKDFFKALSTADGLTHLARLRVHIWSWDDFETAMGDFPNLALRWFLALRPNGWLPLDKFFSNSISQRQGFRAYLDANILPYYSLETYLQSNPSLDISDENKLLEEIVNDDCIGYILKGTGGIGKTRLMFELGRRAQIQNWTVLVATSTLELNALQECVSRSASSGSKWLFLVDYAETNPQLSELWEKINQLNLPGKLVRIIATARSTAVSRLKNSDLKGVKWIDMSPPPHKEGDWFIQYRRAVIAHILEPTNARLTEQKNAKFTEMPALAAFAFFLFRSGSDTNFNLNLKELLEEKSFKDYLCKRVRNSIGNLDTHLKAVTFLLAQLPWNDSVNSKVRDTYEGIRSALYTDRWIDKSNTQWNVAHDIFTDTLLHSHMQTLSDDRAQDLVPELDSLFAHARALGTTTSCLKSVERLCDQQWVECVKWDDFFLTQIKDYSVDWQKSRIALLQSSLLNAQQKFRLIRESQDFWHDVEAETGYEQAVIEMGQAYEDTHDENPSDIATLSDLYVRGLTLSRTDNKLATNALRHLPPGSETDALVLEIIQRGSDQLQNDFPLVAWLESGRKHEDVESYVKKWLENFDFHYTASYLLRAWLTLCKKPEADKWCSNAVDNWIAQHGTKYATVFVLSSWIRNFKDATTFAKEASDWLAKYGEKESASFLISALLNVKAEVTLIQEPIKSWLESHQESEAARHLYQAWLEAGGEAKLVQESIKIWLKKYQKSEPARHVFKAWLDVRGEANLVKEFILVWLGENGKDENARYVYVSWLNAGIALGNTTVECFKNYLSAWLHCHGSENIAGDVLRALFVYESGKTLSALYLKTWADKIEYQDDHKYATYIGNILKEWLQHNGNPNEITNAVRQWLASNGELPLANLLVEFWERANGNNDAINDWRTKKTLQDSEITNLRQKAKETPHTDALFLDIAQRCSVDAIRKDPGVLNCFPNFDSGTFKTPAGKVLLAAWIDVFTYHAKSKGLEPYDIKNLTRRMTFLFECFSPPEVPRELKNALTLWIRNPQSFSEADPSAHPVDGLGKLLDEIVSKILTDELSDDADREHLGRIFDWSAAHRMPLQIEAIKRNLHNYETQHPEKSALWQDWRRRFCH